MKPINFEGSNQVMGGQVPANCSSQHGFVLSRRRMSFSERLSILFFGKIWVAVKGESMPPTLVSGNQQFEMIMNDCEDDS